MDLEELFEGHEMEVEANVEEEMEVNEEEEMEWKLMMMQFCQTIRDSDRFEDIPDEIFRVLNQAEVNMLNPLKKMCCIYSYFTPGHMKFCASCIVRIHGLFSMLYAVRRHDTYPYILINGLFCSSCGDPLYLISPCNLCPMCVFV